MKRETVKQVAVMLMCFFEIIVGITLFVRLFVRFYERICE